MAFGPARARAVAALLASTAVVVGSIVGAAPATAAAPDAPALLSPADGATTSGTDVPLTARATDPDGGSLDVRFEGREVGAAAPGSAADPFTFAVLPDTQNYTYAGRQGTILAQSQWLVSQRDPLDLAFVAHLGDLVSAYDIADHWDHVSAGLAPLDAAHMPRSVLPGNHDFNNATGDLSWYDRYFPPSRFTDTWTPSTSRYGGYLGQNLFGPDPIDRRNMDNFALFSAGGTDFIVLNLEYEAPAYALEWGRKVLAAYPERTAIMATHSFISTTGSRRTTVTRPEGTSPARLWSEFVSQQCSIRLVVSGHEHNGDLGESRRTDNNSCGQPVHQIMTDYQDRANGGNGWLRYYTFDPAAGTLRATTYSPTLQQYETDADSAFTVPFELTPATPAPFERIDSVTAASGATATTTWTDLEPDTAYEWRVVAGDGDDTSASAPRTFRTPPSGVLADDTFSRSATGSWGTTDSGQQWSLSGTSSGYAVSGGVGRMTVAPSGSRTATLPAVVAQDVGIVADVGLASAASGSGTYASLVARSISGSSYRARARFMAGGDVLLQITRVLGGTETVVSAATVPGLKAVAGQPIRVRTEVTGTSPTTIRARAWVPGAAEPSGWLVTSTDSSAALQQPGAVGLSVYLSGTAATTTVLLDRFTVQRPGTTTPPPANVAPMAVIGTPVVSGRSVSVSGAGSTDGDGTVVGWDWDFGDGSSGSGASTSHTYAADGTYAVRLTVRDDDGATSSSTRSVTVSTPPPAGVLARDTFERTSSSGWGSAETGGPWTVTGAASRYTVASGAGTLTNSTAGGALEAALAGVSSSATEVRADLSWDRTSAAGALYTPVTSRRVNARSSYAAKVVVPAAGRFSLQLVRRVDNAETTVASVALPLTQVARTRYSVATQAVTSGGRTTLRAKLWPSGTAEPAWQVTATDTTAALQGPGGIAVGSYMSSSATAPVATTVDEVRVVTVTP
jgi:hypothetical protein|nr:domain containing protein [Aeromicrobium sp.]